MKTWQDVLNSTIAKVCKGKAYAYQFDPKIDRSLGKYFDQVLGYSFRNILNDVYNKGYFSYSENYVEFLKKIDEELERNYSETAKFVNMWINFHQYAHLLKEDVADCFKSQHQ